MNNLLTPIVLVVLAVGLYFTYTGKEYEQVKALQETNKQYVSAISSWKDLLAARDKLNDQYNAIAPQDLARLNKMLPNTIDNVRLIIEMNGILQRFGLPAQNIAVSTDKDTTSKQTTTPVTNTPGAVTSTVAATDSGLKTATMSFQVTTTYDNFQKLLKELQSSLRMLDVTNITLAAKDKEPYDYTFTVKTYWMK